MSIFKKNKNVNKPKQDNAFKRTGNSINEMTSNAKDMVNFSSDMAKNITKLPWDKLPVSGYIYLVVALILLILMAVFVVPAVTF